MLTERRNLLIMSLAVIVFLVSLILLFFSWALDDEPLRRLGALLPSSAFSQEPERVEIPIGAILKVTWEAVPDTDVVAYNVNFTGEDSLFTPYFVEHYMTTWWKDADSDTLMQTISPAKINLPLGEGYAMMQAIDRSGNRSEDSNRVYYTIVDVAPSAVLFFMLEVVK